MIPLRQSRSAISLVVMSAIALSGVALAQAPSPQKIEAKFNAADVNHDGKPDMIIHAQDQIWVFINDNGKFRPATPDDHVSV